MIKNLLAYQEKDAQLREIEQTLAKSEDRKKAINAKKYLEGVEDGVNKLDTRSGELFGAFQKAGADLNKLKEQENALKEALNTAEDQKEANFLIKKAEELIANIQAIEARIIQIAEEIQSVLKEYVTIKETSKKAQAQYKEYAEKYNALKESFKDKRLEIEKELSDLAKKVDKDLMARYNEKRANKIYPIVYQLRGEVCGACGMELNLSEQAKIKNGEVIECGNCGRLLYK